jgi:hypothetical protein
MRGIQYSAALLEDTASPAFAGYDTDVISITTKSNL